MAAKMSFRRASQVLRQQTGIPQTIPQGGSRGAMKAHSAGGGMMPGLNRGLSSSSEGSDKSATDIQREDILETGKRVDVSRVKEVPAPTKQKWWKPDPITGVWVPEDTRDHANTAQVRSNASLHSKHVHTFVEILQA
eukprot:TRINITY_DN17276_c0_g1_i1.p1 TRINITY_DN17276_c0_g1~~TRINITY_DN17276_c0_g1_i1.p1  ORF type:complete len:137 (+),score=11.41 TRINITY_DN17276_c0_g1_i1:356-766(+)